MPLGGHDLLQLTKRKAYWRGEKSNPIGVDRLLGHAPERHDRQMPAASGEAHLEVTIHHGRHTFISHALAGGRTLAEVRDAAGHSNVSITSSVIDYRVELAPSGEGW